MFCLQIVGIGLNGVFELIKETCHGFPGLCVKALQALLDMLQGQQPESMKLEPADVIGEFTKTQTNPIISSN